MKVIKPQVLGVLHRTFEHRRAYYFVVTVIAGFRLTDPKTPVQEALLWKVSSDELGRDGVLDLGMSKERGEVLATGRAFTRNGPQPAVSVRIQCGPVDKTLYVVGDRFWETNGASASVPFTEMPVSWSRAFGGPKVPENPVGRGLHPTPVDDGAQRVYLPNVEDPKALVKTPRDRPAPAGFAPQDLLWPQRFAKMGTYDSAWQKELYPGLARDLDWSIFNAALPDQWIEGYFHGDEAFAITNMHPELAVIEGRLPGHAARAFIRQTTAPDVLREIAMRIDTVHFFPHKDLGMMIFRGMVPVGEDDASDVVHLLVANELASAPKSVEHYAAILERRLQKKPGSLLSLRNEDLMPPGQPSVDRMIKDLAPDFEVPDQLGARNRRRGLERRHEDLRAKLVEKGVDPDKHLPPLPPEVRIDLGVDAALAKNDEAVAEAAVQRDKAMAELATRTDELRGRLAKEGIDYDEALRKSVEANAGPPKSAVDERLAAGRAFLARARAGGHDVTQAEAMLEGQVVPMLKKAHHEAVSAYRRFAQHFPEPRRLDQDASAHLRVRLELGAREGVAFRDVDFTGADLRGVAAPGANLSGAFLEAANLEGADLTGASLEEAVFVRANLKGAKLRGASGRAVNCAKADLDGADLGEARLEGAVFVDASLARAKLDGAKLSRTDLSGAKLEGCDLSAVSAKRARFIKNALAGARFVGADLQGALFVENDLTDADFSGANLERASFVTARGERARFVGARATKLRMAKESRFDRADFTSAVLDGANLRATSFEEASFVEAHLEGADLSESHAPRSRFCRAFARGARFMKTVLDGADLSGIDLLGGSLMKASIRGTNLEGASLFAVDFARAVGDDATSMKGANVKRVRVTPK